MKKILVLNSGSSTLKYQLFNVDGESYEVVAKGNAERIGRDASFVGIKYANGDKKEVKVDLPDHKTALNEVMKLLTDGVIGNLNEISAIGHRIVQGGSIFKGSVVVTEKVIEDIESLSTLAPLHNPSAALVIRAVMKELPSVPQVVVLTPRFIRRCRPRPISTLCLKSSVRPTKSAVTVHTARRISLWRRRLRKSSGKNRR